MENGQIVAIVAIILLVILALIYIGSIIKHSDKSYIISSVFGLIFIIVLIAALWYLAATDPEYGGYVAWLVILLIIVLIIYLIYLINRLVRMAFVNDMIARNRGWQHINELDAKLDEIRRHNCDAN